MGALVASKFAEDKPLEGFIDMYLSDAHRDHPERGCPLPTMAAELGQRGQPSPSVDSAVQHRTGLMAQALGLGEAAEAKSLVMLSTLIGALVLSRSVEDQDFAARILSTAREALKSQAQAAEDIP
jgi:hypothetical protein